MPTSRPPTWSKVRWLVELPEFLVPEWMKKVLNTENTKKSIAQIRPRMPAVFNLETYGKYWGIILHAEEWQQRYVRSSIFAAAPYRSLYQCESVKIQYVWHTATKTAITLQVRICLTSVLPASGDLPPWGRLYIPGLTEGKPRLLVGDKLLLCNSGEQVWHEGIVHIVAFQEVVLHINSKFRLRGSNDPVDVRFQINRIPWRRRQQAVTLSDNQSRLLFPNVQDAAPLRLPTVVDMEGFTFEDPCLVDNDEQKSVVVAIVKAPPGSVPFIVFGPYALSPLVYSAYTLII